MSDEAGDQTTREKLAEALRAGPVSARDLSQMVGISEREVRSHLEHVRRSIERGGERFVVEAAHCKKCGFAFESRKKMGIPSRCPKCKAERIEPPRFAVA
ncbi:MAG TPA: transcriptional regulator [Polyangiaceae bacterium]|nr:transcriptional regulator [Polyangiaceae bacterium]